MDLFKLIDEWLIPIGFIEVFVLANFVLACTILTGMGVI